MSFNVPRLSRKAGDNNHKPDEQLMQGLVIGRSWVQIPLLFTIKGLPPLDIRLNHCPCWDRLSI